jgi:hypothetical protein
MHADASMELLAPVSATMTAAAAAAAKAAPLKTVPEAEPKAVAMMKMA